MPAVALIYIDGPTDTIIMDGYDVQKNYGRGRYYNGTAPEGTAITYNGTLKFVQAGTYQLKAVSGWLDENNAIHVEDQQDISITVSGEMRCEDYTTQEECEAHGCYWYNNACHTQPQGGKYLPILLLGGALAIVGIAYVSGKKT